MRCLLTRGLWLSVVLGVANPLVVAQLPTLPTLIDSITGSVGGGIGGYSLDGTTLGTNPDGSTYDLDKWAAADVTIDTTYAPHQLTSVQVIVRPENADAWDVQHPGFSFQIWYRGVPPGEARTRWYVAASTSIYTKPSWSGTRDTTDSSPGVPLTFSFEQSFTLVGGRQYYFALNPDFGVGNYVFCSRPYGQGYLKPANTTTTMAIGFVAGKKEPAGKFPPYYIAYGGGDFTYPQIIINPQFVPEPIAYPLGLGVLALGAVLVRRIRRGRA